MNSSTKLSLLLASSMIGMQAFAQEPAVEAQRVVPFAIAALIGALKDAEDLKNVILAAYNGLPPAEQQQIVSTLSNMLVSAIQGTQTTSTAPTTPTTSSTPTANTSTQAATTGLTITL